MRDDGRRISVIGLLQAAAVLTVVFSVLTGLDIPHHGIELFSHFRLQYLVVSLLLLAVFGVLRSYAYAGALVVTAIFNATFILPLYSSDDLATDGEPFKLVHANVRSSNTDYDRLVDFVNEVQPDVVFLQEVTSDWVAGTRTLLADYPYTYAEPRQGNFGIAAFSKTPFDSIRHLDSPPLGHPTIVATLTVNGTRLNIISSHPTIPLGRNLYEARNEQLDSVVELLGQTTGRVVLLGDFNASIWDMHFRRLQESAGLKSVRQGFGVLPSWPTYMPFAMIPIDHALVSESISVTDARTGSSIGSDHLPLVVTLSL